MASEPVIAAKGINHAYGAGAVRRQILFDVSTEIYPGEIVVMTGPSGSGKTTLLTLIGCLRSAQEGSLRVLGHELNGASDRLRARIRRQIGFIFQAHNLLEMLTVRQNVETSRSGATRSLEALESVGLAAHADARIRELSGGQKQRVAVARALAGHPRILLADEPTASLDRQSGREIVDRVRDLARRQGCAVLLCTHDNRILDVADRLIHMEDGRLSSFASAVFSNMRQLLDSFARNNRGGDLTRRVRDLPLPQFGHLLEQVTGEFQQFLSVMDMSHNEAFESMLEQVIEAFTLKIGQILQADRVTLFLVDSARKELWSKVAQATGERPLEIRIPLGSGIAGHVAVSGEPRNVPDAYRDPLFNRDVDMRTGYKTQSLLCMPVVDSRGNVVAVVQLLNKSGGTAFDRSDEQQFRAFAASMSAILESWARMIRPPTLPDPGAPARL